MYVCCFAEYIICRSQNATVGKTKFWKTRIYDTVVLYMALKDILIAYAQNSNIFTLCGNKCMLFCRVANLQELVRNCCEKLNSRRLENRYYSLQGTFSKYRNRSKIKSVEARY